MFRRVSLVFVGLIMSTTAWSAPKPKLLVQDFKAKGTEPHEASVISSAACVAFSKSPRYDVLCGDDLRNLMQFGALASSFNSCQDDSCYASLGEAMQARFLVTGSVTKVKSLYILSLSLLDTKVGKTTARTEIKASSIEKLHQDTPEAVSAILKPKPSS